MKVRGAVVVLLGIFVYSAVWASGLNSIDSDLSDSSWVVLDTETAVNGGTVSIQYSQIQDTYRIVNGQNVVFYTGDPSTTDQMVEFESTLKILKVKKALPKIAASLRNRLTDRAAIHLESAIRNYIDHPSVIDLPSFELAPKRPTSFRGEIGVEHWNDNGLLGLPIAGGSRDFQGNDLGDTNREDIWVAVYYDRIKVYLSFYSAEYSAANGLDYISPNGGRLEQNLHALEQDQFKIGTVVPLDPQGHTYVRAELGYEEDFENHGIRDGAIDLQTHWHDFIGAEIYNLTGTTPPDKKSPFVNAGVGEVIENQKLHSRWTGEIGVMANGIGSRATGVYAQTSFGYETRKNTIPIDVYATGNVYADGGKEFRVGVEFTKSFVVPFTRFVGKYMMGVEYPVVVDSSRYFGINPDHDPIYTISLILRR